MPGRLKGTPAFTGDDESKLLDYYDVLLRASDASLLTGPHWLNDQVRACPCSSQPLPSNAGSVAWEGRRVEALIHIRYKQIQIQADTSM